MERRLYIGKPGHFRAETVAIERLMRQLAVAEEKDNVVLSPEPNPQFDWLLDAIHKKHEDSFEIRGKVGMLGLHTSGTTGEPKRFWKDLTMVVEAKKGRGTSLDRWLLTYNPARWAGLSVLLHVIKHGGTMVVPQDLTTRSILDAMASATHLSLTPSLFRRLLVTDPEALTRSPIKQVTFGGEFATQKVLDDAKTSWPGARITHTYASTELGDIWGQTDGKEGFPESKLAGCRLTKEGELVMGGVHTGDLWKVKDGRLLFIGRKQEMINVGGFKVSPLTVETVTNEIEGIVQSRAYAIENALVGQVVGLDYVGSIEVQEVSQHLRKALPRQAVPLKIRRVDTIDLTAASKLSRRA